MHIGIRGRSQTTLTRFLLFWPPTPMHWHFVWYNRWQKSEIFWTTYLPRLVNVVCERTLNKNKDNKKKDASHGQQKTTLFQTEKECGAVWFFKVDYMVISGWEFWSWQSISFASIASCMNVLGSANNDLRLF